MIVLSDAAGLLAVEVRPPRRLLASASKAQKLDNSSNSCNTQDIGHERKHAPLNELVEQTMYDHKNRPNVVPLLYSFPSGRA